MKQRGEQIAVYHTLEFSVPSGWQHPLHGAPGEAYWLCKSCSAALTPEAEQRLREIGEFGHVMFGRTESDDFTIRLYLECDCVEALVNLPEAIRRVREELNAMFAGALIPIQLV